MVLTTDFYPDSIVDYVVQELSYEGSSGVSFDKLWELLSVKVKVDELYKKIIYAWLSENEKIEIIQDNNEVVSPKPSSYNEIELGRYFIKVSNGFQWISLTGSPKENNPIGGMAFDLLVEIAKSRSEGIDSLSLTKATGQDARSLTQRIKVLGSLVQKIPIIRNGRTLSLLILTKFYNAKKVNVIAVNENSDSITVSSEDIRSRIINALKAAKHGIRQVGDLRREMEMDKSPKLKRVFRSSVNYLESKRYLAKVLVVSPAVPKRKFSALKYIIDYSPKSDNQTEDGEAEEDDDEEEDETFNEGAIDDELKNLGEEELPTSLTNVEDIQIKSADEATDTPLFNRHFPYQNQIYEIIDETALIGISSGQIIESVFGLSYRRLFAKLIDCYTSGKLIPHLANYGIIRHYDFKGRTKFYRHLSRPNFLVFSNKAVDPDGSKLPAYKAATSTLKLLNKKYFAPLNAGVDLVEHDGISTIYWFGNLNDISAEHRAALRQRNNTPSSPDSNNDTSKRKRGRPKKGDEGKLTKAKKSKKEKITEVAVIPDPDTGTIESVVPSQVADYSSSAHAAVPTEIDPDLIQNKSPTDAPKEPAAIETSVSKDLTVADLQGPSFKAIERLRGIIEVLEDNEGVFTYDFRFLEAVREKLGLNIDKRTFGRDIQMLKNQQKVCTEEFFGRLNTFRIIYTSSTSSDTINTFKDVLKGKKTAKALVPKKHDEVKDVHLEFFDHELSRSFHEAPPAKKVKRERSKSKTDMVKEVQRKSKELGENVSIGQSPGGHSKKKPSKKAASEAKPKKKTPLKPKTEENVDDLNWDANSKKARKPHGIRKKRNASHLNSSETMLLFKAVIICKTIDENQINWGKISNLFQGISEEVLRKKWPRVRLLMGPEGSKVARRTWKRILLAAVREDKITLPEVEELDLEALVKLWQDAEMAGGVEETSEPLYANYEENFAHYNFVKSTAISNAFSYDSNSMVQREQYLVSKSFTYKEAELEDEATEETAQTEPSHAVIRRIIIAILASGQNANIRKLPLLDSFDKKHVDDTFLEMTKRKEILVGSDSKVVLGETLTHILDDTSYDISLQKVSSLYNIFKNIFEADKGLILDPIFDNSFMVPIVELLSQNSLDLVRVDHYRREVLSGYEARTLEREKLDCDIIITKGKHAIKEAATNSPLVPMGKPCSRIWIDVEGQINKVIWNKVNRAVLTSILSQPGITIPDLHTKLNPLLSKAELLEVVRWLKDGLSIIQKDYESLWLLPGWYTIFGV